MSSNCHYKHAHRVPLKCLLWILVYYTLRINMETSEPPSAKMARHETNFSICLICQQETAGDFVKRPLPTSYKRVLECIEELAKYGKDEYPEINRRLHGLTADDLKANGASWHRNCYQVTCNKGKLGQARDRFEQQVLHKEAFTPRGSPSPQVCSGPSTDVFTRSKSTHYDSDVCFFCGNKSTYRNPLFKVRTDEAGQNLHDAVMKSGNPALRVKLNTAINPKDAHAIDIQYHNKCYTKNVTNVIRQTQSSDHKHQSAKREVAADIEFLSFIQEALQDGEIIPLANLHDTYEIIRQANEVSNPTCHRQKVKQLLENEIPGIEFHRPKQQNMSYLVSLKGSRDTAIVEAYEATDIDANMKTLFEAANILNQVMSSAKKWTFQGSLTDITDEHVPSELYTFYRWVLQGPKSSGCKDAVVDERAKSLAQQTMSLHLSNRQARTKTTVTRSHEMPQQLGLGVAVRQATRGKKVINILHKYDVSVSYERLLRLETQIANTVIRRMQKDGVHIPADIVTGRHIFFAVDNVDFAEDTPNGKNTLHSTVTVMYQKRDLQDTARRLELSPSSHEKSLKEPPETELLQCRMPKSPKPCCPTYTDFSLNEPNDSREVNDDLVWLMGQSVKGPVLPCWAGYNSMISKCLPLTSWHTLPLIPAPAHEWQTLLTVLKQAQHISSKVVGSHRKTIITLDMGLYRPAKQLQMARDDLNHIVLRPGELHTVMAQLRTIGTYIDNSGIDMCWAEADLYGTATIKQIIEGRHVNRGVNAHLTTLQALFKLYGDAFFRQNPDLLELCTQKTDLLTKACESNNHEDIQAAHADFTQALNSSDIAQLMKSFDDDMSPLGKAILNYMQMVLDMTMYIRAVRTANWQLHLYATEVFVKYFFAHDKLNYARLIPVYLADMKYLAKTDPELWKEFDEGNWVVNKSSVPFCAIGADHALEQENRMMKVCGGIVGITQNQSALTKFFLVAPELSHIASEARQMADVKSTEKSKHHTLTDAKALNQERNVTALTSTIRQFVNPFSEEHDDVINIVTKAIMSEAVQKDLQRRNEKGQEMFATFVSERITSSKITLWAPMKKVNLQTWSSSVVSVKVKDNLIELKEDRALFARLLVVSKTRDIDLQHNIGKYEFSVVPRALFAPDGSLLHTSTKSDLMHILESLPADVNAEDTVTALSAGAEDASLDHMETNSEGCHSVAIVDGMPELQTLDKPEWIQTCFDLANHFITTLWDDYDDYDEVHLVFDRYDISEHSLKAATRENRLAGHKAVAYRITDSTSIANISRQKLLAHVKTKDELTTYIAQKVLQHDAIHGKHIVVAWRDQAESSHRIVNLSSSQEEADTKLMLHAVEATRNGATSLRIFSPDTDVLVLAIRRYASLPPDSAMVTGTSGAGNRRSIALGPIYNSLGPSKAAALPGLHAFSGADITGKLAGNRKGKKTWWKVFEDLDEDHDIIEALSKLGETLTDAISTALEALVCRVYIPSTKIVSVADARWWLFKRKQAQGADLPPTKAALKHAIARAHYQAFIWNNDIVPFPNMPSPEQFGWKKKDGMFMPEMTNLPPAPDALTQLVKCGCKSTRCSGQQCKCRKNNLQCTDFCTCGDEEEACTNVPDISDNEMDSDDQYDGDDF